MERRERDRTKKSCNGQLTKHQFDEPKKGWPPPPLVPPAVLLIHVVEHRVPGVCLDVGPIVLIEAMAWPRIVSFDFKGFTHLEVEDEFFFVFVGHGGDDSRIIPVDVSFACLFVLRDARV